MHPLFAQSDLPPQMLVVISPQAAMILGILIVCGLVGGFYVYGLLTAGELRNLRNEIAAARRDQSSVTDKLANGIIEMKDAMHDLRLALAVLDARTSAHVRGDSGFIPRPGERA